MSLICGHYKTLNLQLESSIIALFISVKQPASLSEWLRLFGAESQQWLTGVSIYLCQIFVYPWQVAHMGFLPCLLSAVVMYLGLSRCGKICGMKVKRRHPAFPWKWVSYHVNKLHIHKLGTEGWHLEKVFVQKQLKTFDSLS